MDSKLPISIPIYLYMFRTKRHWGWLSYHALLDTKKNELRKMTHLFEEHDL